MRRREKKKCALSGCELLVHAGSYCDKHYRRWKKTGDPIGNLLSRDAAIIDRIWSRVDKSGDCWVYTGMRSRQGYGIICIKGGTAVVHHTEKTSAFDLITGTKIIHVKKNYL